MPRLLSLLTTIALLTGCGLTPETEQVIKANIAANAGHVRDQGLPASARKIALVNHDTGYAILFNEGSISEIPSDVRARRDARAGGAR